MKPDVYIFDDPVREPPTRDAVTAAFDATLGPVLRSGSYRNRLGETVTWEAGEHWLALHTDWREGDLSWLVR